MQSAGWNGEAAARPNPASGVVMIDLTLLAEGYRIKVVRAAGVVMIDLTLPAAQKLSVTITDITGRAVHNTQMQRYPKGKSSVSVSMSSWAAGRYFYSVASEDGQRVTAGSVVRE